MINQKSQNSPMPQEKALLGKFEKNIEIVAGILEDFLNTTEHQLIEENLGEDQKEDIILKTSLIKGLKENAAFDVYVAMYMGCSLWGNSLNEILMWLTHYMPEFKSKIEKQYSDIIKQLNAIPSKCRTFKTNPNQIRRSKQTEEIQTVGLLGLQDRIRKLADDLRYCAKIAREDVDLASTKQNGNSDATPKTDASLIYQANASTFYNIPKSVLSKAAQKQPGEPGYLWSGRNGKRVFYKKADIEKISRSRTKLKS